jgi:transaldolase
MTLGSTVTSPKREKGVETMHPLRRLMTYGQSYWMDNLTRGMITSGELRQRVMKEDLRGITSNPSIVHQAIAGSHDYDTHIAELISQRRSPSEIYEQLVVGDVQKACNILGPVYEKSEGVDGFVSLEVSPYLAHDTTATMQEARRLAQAVNRPNVFIKIPGTPAGVPAIEQMLYEGININVTLHTLTSVASFFLSRIDTLVDQLLCHRMGVATDRDGLPQPEQLAGKAAIANAKLAYQRFKQICNGPRWEALAKHGAQVQRLLWASTSTKNPTYHDVHYIEPLI